MSYNTEQINNRIDKEISNYIEQSDSVNNKDEFFSKYIGCSRQNFYMIAQRGNIPDLSYLERLCEVFNCEINYLLCETDCKTRQLADIQEITGLSENAINSIIELKKHGLIHILNMLLEKMNGTLFFAIMSHIDHYITNYKNNEIPFDKRVKHINKLLKQKNEKAIIYFRDNDYYQDNGEYPELNIPPIPENYDRRNEILLKSNVIDSFSRLVEMVVKGTSAFDK